MALCPSKQLLTYPTGREIVGPDDDAHAASVTDASVDADDRPPARIAAIVRSEVFRSRRGEP